MVALSLRVLARSSFSSSICLVSSSVALTGFACVRVINCERISDSCLNFILITSVLSTAGPGVVAATGASDVWESVVELIEGLDEEDVIK